MGRTKQEKYQPAAAFNQLTGMFHTHFFTHILQSLLRPISKQKFYDLPKDLRTIQSFKAYLKAHSNSDLKSGGKYNLILNLFQAFRVELILATVLMLVSSVLMMLGPLFMKKIIHFLERRKTLKLQLEAAQHYLLIWVVLYIVKIALTELGERLFFEAGIRVDQTLNEAIVRKLARLPISIKEHLSKGQIMNYVMIDVKLVAYFFKYITIALTAPTIIIMGTVFLLVAGQSYSIMMTITLIILSFILFTIVRWISQQKSKKLELQYERINLSTELICQIKQVRQMGYEQLIVKKTRLFRARENVHNFFVYCFTYVYDVVLGSIPMLIIFLVFFKQQIDTDDKSVSAEELYALFSYSMLITYPLKHLRSLTSSTLDMIFALQRIDKFLHLPEVNVIYPSLKQQIETGHIAIQNIVLCQEPLDDRHVHLFGQRHTIHQRAIKVPLTLQLTSGSKVIILSKQGEGRQFLSALGGMSNIEQGRVSYGGIMTYSPSKPWLSKDTIRHNILFGRSEDEDWFKQVCNVCELAEDIECLPDKVQTMVYDINHFSYSFSKKISLARHLYSNPDIFLLDDPFQSIDPRTAKRIFSKIMHTFPSKTMFMSCDQPELLESYDNVLVFYNGVASTFGTIGELLLDNQSPIHKFLMPKQTSFREKDIELRARLAQHLKMNAIDKQMEAVRQKASKKHIQSEGNEEDEKDDHGQHHKHNDGGHQHEGHHHGHQVNGELREPRIPLKKYWKLLNASKSNLLIVVVILMIASQIVKAFGAWWISHVNHHHGKILLKHEHHNTRIFLQVISLFVVFHLVEGLISAYLSKTNSDSFSDTAIQSLARSEMRFFEEHDLIVVALKANKDFEDTFSIIYYFQTVLRNILLFLFTLFSISIEAPEFLIVGAFIAITAVVSYTLFSRTEREIMRYYTPTYEDTQKEFEQYIDGIESIKPLGKLERLRTIWDTKLHDLYVIKINEKYIYHALNIMMELITMTVVVVPALYAINNKRSLNEHDIHTFTILIVYSTKLTGLMSMILKDCAYVENMMRLSIKKNLDLIDLLPEKNPNSPSDDIFWPSSSSVKLENVTVSNQLYAKPELSQVTLSIKEGSRVVLIGKQSEGVQAIKKLMCREGNWQNKEGRVLIDKKDITRLTHKDLSDQVMHVAARPFTLTGSLRENIDPLDQFRDRDIIRILSNFNIENSLKWKVLQADEKSWKYFLEQRINFEDISTSMRNSINIARALLRQPSILICDNLQPNKCIDSAQDLLSEKLRQTTIVTDSVCVNGALKSTKVIILEKGKIVENDSPMSLLARQTQFAEFVRDNERYCRPKKHTENDI